MIERLAIVEDNAAERALIVETMRPHCTTIYDVGRLDHALELIRQTNPDAIMLDLMLPDSPVEPLKTIAAVRLVTQSAIIVVSSLGDPKMIAEGILNGADGWFVKGDWLNLPWEVMRAYSQHRHESKLCKLETDFFKI